MSNNIPIKQIAKEDIPVFKIMTLSDKSLHSIYYNFKYEKGVVYCTELGEVRSIDLPSNSTDFFIYEGFHSYSNNCVAKLDRVSLCYSTKFITVYIKDYVLLARIVCNSTVKVKCIIPKGSEYYLNEKGEYVSNQIKIISIEDVLGK